MPLVRIDLRKGKDATYRQEVGRAVYDALLSVGVPNNDRFQIIAEHPPAPEGSGIRYPKLAIDATMQLQEIQ